MDHVIEISYLSGKSIDEVISELTRLKIEYSTKNIRIDLPEKIKQTNLKINKAYNHYDAVGTFTLLT